MNKFTQFAQEISEINEKILELKMEIRLLEDRKKEIYKEKEAYALELNAKNQKQDKIIILTEEQKKAFQALVDCLDKQIEEDRRLREERFAENAKKSGWRF